jgi:hypothetical protein
VDEFQLIINHDSACQTAQEKPRKEAQGEETANTVLSTQLTEASKLRMKVRIPFIIKVFALKMSGPK